MLGVCWLILIPFLQYSYPSCNTHILPAILTVGWLDTTVVCKLWWPPESGGTPSDSRGQPWHTGEGKDNNYSSESLNLCSQLLQYMTKMWKNTATMWTSLLLDLGWVKSSVRCQPGRPWPGSWATTTSRSKCGTGDRGEGGSVKIVLWLKWWCGASEEAVNLYCSIMYT